MEQVIIRTKNQTVFKNSNKQCYFALTALNKNPPPLASPRNGNGQPMPSDNGQV